MRNCPHCNGDHSDLEEQRWCCRDAEWVDLQLGKSFQKAVAERDEARQIARVLYDRLAVYFGGQIMGRWAAKAEWLEEGD